MTPAFFIRTQVFGARTQEEFGEILGYAQEHISRMEGGYPISRPAQDRIREAAQKRGIHWDNRWFFEVPSTAA